MHIQSTKVYFQSTKLYFQSEKYSTISGVTVMKKKVERHGLGQGAGRSQLSGVPSSKKALRVFSNLNVAAFKVHRNIGRYPNSLSCHL